MKEINWFMNRYIMRREAGIVNNKYGYGWKIYERIGKVYGKKTNAEEYWDGRIFKTRREAEKAML